MSQIIKNRYQIIKLLGKGGMAEVYLAYDLILKREVAIKILKADMADDEIALERFKREAGATTNLSHPNIVEVYDVGQDGDTHFIVMEYVKGYTLKQLIKKRGPIGYKETVWMMKQLAGALLEAHRKGIIHRDIKSQNVLIKPDGTIKLSDFGIAVANDAIQLTSKDSVLGSVHYLAPELSKGKSANMQSDIYSLGIVFFELLTGDVPFKGESAVQVALMHVKNKIPEVRKINPEIPQSVENILIKATAKSLDQRYKNVALMLKDLNECLKKEHLNDPKVDFNNNYHEFKKVSLADTSNTTLVKKKGFKWFYILLSMILGLSLLSGVLYLGGVFDKKETTTTVPNILGLSVLEARDLLNENNLEIDNSHITYSLSDDIEKGLIISVSPSVDSIVDLNSEVKIEVSSGLYSILDNYVGMNYLQAESDLKEKNFIVHKYPVESNKEPGIVVSQSLQAGYKYDGQVNNEIKIEYSQIVDIILDPSLKGKSLSVAQEYFANNNIAYELKCLSISEFSEEEIANIENNCVVKTDPQLGSSYNQSKDSKVIVYYFMEEKLPESEEVSE